MLRRRGKIELTRVGDVLELEWELERRGVELAISHSRDSLRDS
jgi:hypothetical protein